MIKTFSLVTLFTVCLWFSVNAQKTSAADKAVEKEWAKKLKELKPLDYKKLVEEKDGLTQELTSCENSKSNLKNDLDSKDAEIARLKKELQDAKDSLQAAKDAQAQALAQSHTTKSTTNTKTSTNTKTKPTTTNNTNKPVTQKTQAVPGLVYKVQIGTFKNRDYSKYFNNNPNFSGEVDSDGTKRYTLGLFTDYWEADNFKKALREMGVKDAWVVAYKDGQRMNMKDVLEGVVK